MSVREAVNTSKAAALVVSIVIFVIAGVTLFLYLRPERAPVIDHCYYSDDDGKTYYVDTIYCVPPFQHDGATAVRAMVYTYDNGSKKYVAYLQRFTVEMKKKLDDACAAAVAQGKPLSSVAEFYSKEIPDRGLEIKLPGPSHPWIQRNTAAALDVMNNPPPDGGDREADVP
jgi:hypothetical protein